MAKKENMVDLTAGLTAGLTFDDAQRVADVGTPERRENVTPREVGEIPGTGSEGTASGAANPTGAEIPAPDSTSKGLAEIYADKMDKRQQESEKARKVRIQVVVTRNTAKMLDELVAQQKIKSKNDLINFLLEGYLETLK